MDLRYEPLRCVVCQQPIEADKPYGQGDNWRYAHYHCIPLVQDETLREQMATDVGR